MRWTHVLAVIAALAVPNTAAARAVAQAEIDRIVSRVNDKIITQSDVRQAMLLKLVDDPTSEDSTRRCLEDRLLILNEIGKLATATPGPESDFTVRRSTWEASVGGRGRISELMGRTALSEAGLDAWLRDDLRIQGHLKRQFGAVPEADRPKAVADWVSRLRQRAGLK